MAIEPTSTKVLVTGANGFIGLHTILHFLKAGYHLSKTKPVVDTLGWNHSISTEHARSILGWQPRPYHGTVVAMAETLIEQGMV